MKCSVLMCKNSQHAKKMGISFHKYPKDVDLRKQWLDAVSSAGCNDHDVICSDHFEKKDLLYISRCVVLRHDAVPSLKMPTSMEIDMHICSINNSANQKMPNLPESPWQFLLKAKETPYFFSCNENDGSVNYMMTDLKHIWSENCYVEDVIARSKEQNKRIEFDYDTVLTTLSLSPAPEEVILEDSSDGGLVLRLKCYIQSAPFKFFWNLKMGSAEEFHEAVVTPMMLSIYCLNEKCREMVEIVEAKDREIEAYKSEGAFLKRRTAHTETFNSQEYKSKHAKINSISDGLVSMVPHLPNFKQLCQEYEPKTTPQASPQVAKDRKGRFSSIKRRKPNRCKEIRTMHQTRAFIPMAYDEDSDSDSRKNIA